VNAAAKKTRRRPAEPFAFAADLPAAYQELSEAIAAIINLEANGPVPFIKRDAQCPQELSESAISRNANEKAEAWQRVGAAARRVHAAKVGRKWLVGPKEAQGSAVP
jgi:hypothetical protein